MAEMTFHEACNAIGEMVGFIENSGIQRILATAAGMAFWSHLERQAEFAEQERQIIGDEWETVCGEPL